MKLAVMLPVCLVTLIAPVICAAQKNAHKANKTLSFYPNKVAAHRGAWKNTNTPQNSLASLKAAIALKCTASEMDVHMTADSVLIVNHDPHYAGLDIQNSTYEQLSKTKLKNGEPLPLLQGFLDVIKSQTGTRLVLEIKPSQRGEEWAAATVKKVVDMVKESKAAPWVVYISFSYYMCQKVLRLDPSAHVQYLNGDINPAKLKADGMAGLDYHFSVFKKHPEWVQEAKDNKLVLNAWTVNDREEMRSLLDQGFDFITTNEPEMLLELAGSSTAAKK